MICTWQGHHEVWSILGAIPLSAWGTEPPRVKLLSLLSPPWIREGQSRAD